ncbi:MAG: 23S rRNA (pseudouridine(1915)-N(3))-methyltransferase RlmH [Opitutales bacterium]
MRYLIAFAGKPALAFTKGAIDEYTKRLSRYGKYELKIVKAGSSEDVSKRLLEATGGCYRIALDERGQTPTTRELSTRLKALELDGATKTVAFLIGASDGHTEALRHSCDCLLSLSKLTLQHEFALAVLLEQLYRVASIQAGSPYHRD